MNSYTTSARLFLVSVWLLWSALLILTLCSPYTLGDYRRAEGIGLALVLAAIAGARQVTLLRSPRFSEAAKISLGFLVTFSALLTFGTPIGVMVGLVSAFTATLYPRRQPLHQALFNVCAIIISAWLSGKTLYTLHPTAESTGSLTAL